MGNVSSLADAPPHEAQLRLVGLGDALTELVLQVDDATLAALSLQPGSVEEARAQLQLLQLRRAAWHARRGGLSISRLRKTWAPLPSTKNIDALLSAARERTGNHAVRSAGGSAARVVGTLVALGDGAASASLIAVLGADTDGAAYRGAMKANGVSAQATSSAPDVAHSPQWLALLTPDGRRTVRWASGAARQLSAAHVFSPGASSALSGAQLLHMDCWALRRDDAALTAVQRAAKAGAVVSLDLGGPAAPAAVRQCRGALRALLATRAVELVFVDEAAAAALGELSPANGLAPADAGVARLLRYAQVVVLTRGAGGSVTTRRDGTRFATPAHAGVVAAEGADAAGAGDAHAAGFLWALLHGAPLPVCAAAGALAAAEARAVPGAALTAAAVARVRAAAAARDGAVAAAGAATIATNSVHRPHGLRESLAEWLSPGDLAPGGEWPDDDAAGGGDPPGRAEPPGEKSTGHMWGDDGPPPEDDADVDAVLIATNAAAEAKLRATAGVQTLDARGHVVTVRKSPSGRTLTTHADGMQAEECEAGERRHRRLSSRELDRGASAAAELAAACAAPSKLDVSGLTELFTGLGWVHDWVESHVVFGAPQAAPKRMRHSMSSTIAAFELGDTNADHM